MEKRGLQFVLLEDRRMVVDSRAEIGSWNIRLMRTVMSRIRPLLLAMVITGALHALNCVPFMSAVAVCSCSLIRPVHPMTVAG